MKLFVTQFPARSLSLIVKLSQDTSQNYKSQSIQVEYDWSNKMVDKVKRHSKDVWFFWWRWSSKERFVLIFWCNGNTVCFKLQCKRQTGHAGHTRQSKWLGWQTPAFWYRANSIAVNRIFSITSPVSEYFQTHSIDLLEAWRMVETSTNRLQRISRDFHTVNDRAVKFCNGVSRSLSLQTSEEQEILEVSTSLPIK